MEHLLFIEDKLIESIYENIELISCKEMGEMIDMIKDIEKALYYHHMCRCENHDTSIDSSWDISRSAVNKKGSVE